MNTPDWHAEALQFCADNNVCPTETTVGTVERAMLHAAILMTCSINEMFKGVDDDLSRRRASNVTPESGETRMLPNLEKPT